VLHIKLPKKPLARALTATADSHDARVAAMAGVSLTMPQTRTKHWLQGKAARLRERADMAKHSTGDCFVGFDLWYEIKDHYDA